MSRSPVYTDHQPPLCRRYNFFSECPLSKTCTLILRGGSEQFLEETERSLHDAIMIVRRAIKNDSVVAGEWRRGAALRLSGTCR